MVLKISHQVVVETQFLPWVRGFLFSPLLTEQEASTLHSGLGWLGMGLAHTLSRAFLQSLLPRRPSVSRLLFHIACSAVLSSSLHRGTTCLADNLSVILTILPASELPSQ